ncbi:unnamed protein product, partial [Mesorhabditis belari]|uniref:Uncharacterized protein n=1 Tax=Mesorhabditis belari TaxID=2138241 RepID=A0AAF3FPC6_9BILA
MKPYKFILLFLLQTVKCRMLECADSIYSSSAKHKNSKEWTVVMGSMCYTAYAGVGDRTYLGGVIGMKWWTPRCFWDQIEQQVTVMCLCDDSPTRNLNSPNWTASETWVKFGNVTLPLKTRYVRTRCNLYTFKQGYNDQWPTVVGNKMKKTNGTICVINGTVMRSGNISTWTEATWTGRTGDNWSNLYQLDDIIFNGGIPAYNGGIYGYQFKKEKIDLHMTCDWLDFLNETSVFCFLKSSNSTIGICEAQACLLVFDVNHNTFKSGCLWQDWQYAEGRIERGGYVFSPNYIVYVCAEDYCNANWDTISESIDRCSPNYPPFHPYGPSLVHPKSISKSGFKQNLTETYSMTCDLGGFSSTTQDSSNQSSDFIPAPNAICHSWNECLTDGTGLFLEKYHKVIAEWDLWTALLLNIPSSIGLLSSAASFPFLFKNRSQFSIKNYLCCIVFLRMFIFLHPVYTSVCDFTWWCTKEGTPFITNQVTTNLHLGITASLLLLHLGLLIDCGLHFQFGAFYGNEAKKFSRFFLPIVVLFPSIPFLLSVEYTMNPDGLPQAGYRYDPFWRIESISSQKSGDFWNGLMIETRAIYARLSPFIFLANLVLFYNSRQHESSAEKGGESASTLHFVMLITSMLDTFQRGCALILNILMSNLHTLDFIVNTLLPIYSNAIVAMLLLVCLIRSNICQSRD